MKNICFRILSVTTLIFAGNFFQKTKRLLCYTLIDGTGFSDNYTMPLVPYWTWFIDGFNALKIKKSEASNDTTTRVLDSSISKNFEIELGVQIMTDYEI